MMHQLMNIKTINAEVVGGSNLKRPSSTDFQKHFQTLDQMRKMKTALLTKVKSLNIQTQSSKASKWLFNLKIKHQVLVLTFILIMIVSAIFIVISNIQMAVFATLLGDGFNQVLQQSTAKFQSSALIKYMSLTQIYFENQQQILSAINQIYNYTKKSDYEIDLGVECPILNNQNIYPSYFDYDLFCYVPQATKDLQTFENSTLNTDFVKFTSVLNQFILCFGFQTSFQKDGVLQINLDNSDQMGSSYPQSNPYSDYFPTERPFFIFQKQQYELNITRRFYLSKYQKFFKNSGPPVYGQTMTLSLLNNNQFQGVIVCTIQFGVFKYILQNYPDVNLALIALDGTLLFEQNYLQKYEDQQFIYNQSSTGYNYLDWLKLSAHDDYSKQLRVNNTLFSDPINVNIKQFNDLPYYFIVYNNLTYDRQMKSIQNEILNKVNINYSRSLFGLTIIIITILISVYWTIESILKPLKNIQNILHYHDLNYIQQKQQRQPSSSKNILYMLQLVSYLKYSELQNLSFKKSVQCSKIEDIQYSIKLATKNESVLIQYLRQNQQFCINFSQQNDLTEFEYLSSYTGSVYTFTLQ